MIQSHYFKIKERGRHYVTHRIDESIHEALEKVKRLHPGAQIFAINKKEYDKILHQIEGE